MTTPDSPTPHPSANPYPPPPPLPNSATSNPLQFDQVEFGAPGTARPGLSCAACHTPIAGTYYMVNGVVACPQCKGSLHGSLTGGSKIARLIKAFVLGLGATLISALVYFLFVKFTHIEFALVTIGMGWLIGLAVHKGSGGRGGWAYIIIAVFLTYLAIGLSLAGLGVDAMLSENASDSAEDIEMVQGRKATDSHSLGETPTNSASSSSSSDATSSSAAVSPASASPSSTDSASEDPEFKMTSEEKQQFLIAMAMILVTAALVLPFQVAMSSPLLILIYGFGLWQAVRMNIGTKVNITGPYSAGGPPPPLS